MSPGTSRRPAQPQRQLPERFVCPSRATIDHPDTASITVMRRSAMRSRQSLSRTALAVYLPAHGVTVKDDHTDGGT